MRQPVETTWLNRGLSMKNLIIRTLTGLGFVAVTVACIMWNKYSFAVLMTGLMVYFAQLHDEYPENIEVLEED